MSPPLEAAQRPLHDPAPEIGPPDSLSVTSTLPDGSTAWRWELKRNCALTPRQMVSALVLLAGLTGLVGGIGALLGSWLAPMFVVLEWAALALALVVHARHVGDRDVITLQGRQLWVESRDAARTSLCSFDIAWLVVEQTPGPDPLLCLRSRDRSVVVGRHVSRPQRLQAMRELRLALVQARRQLLAAVPSQPRRP